MKSEQSHKAGHTVARISWLVPVLFFALAIYQTKVTIDLGRTVQYGTPAVAEVTRYERSDRKDVTHAELDLRIPLPDGTTLIREKLSLPYSIAHRVEKDTLHVRVLKGTGQEVVISSIVGTQRRIALSNVAMSFVAAMLAFAGVFAWNRHLKRDDNQTNDNIRSVQPTPT